MSGQKIIKGLQDAVAGNFARVTIEGQTWERVQRGECDPPAEQEVTHLGEQCAALLRENERLRAALKQIAKMEPSEIAPETFPGLVHGAALLFANSQRIARAALKSSGQE